MKIGGVVAIGIRRIVVVFIVAIRNWLVVFWQFVGVGIGIASLGVLCKKDYMKFVEIKFVYIERRIVVGRSD